jgi:hypothetical protein
MHNTKEIKGLNPAESKTESAVENLLDPLRRALLNAHFPVKDRCGLPNLTRFFLENGRLPHLTDEVKPWNYKGWLLAYVMEIQRVHPQVVDRWGYHLKTLEAGRLLAEQIPRIEFSSEFDRDVAAGRRELEKWELIVSRALGVWDGFRALVDWLAFAIGVESQSAQLSEKVNEELYRAVNVGPWLLSPSDYLGTYLSERKAGGWNPTAFFPTPHPVCEMMCRMQFDRTERDTRSLKVSDPCVGTGRMLLHASNFSMRLYGQDIDPLVVKICKINGALFAPWLAFALPDDIFQDEDAAEIKSSLGEINSSVFETNQRDSETEPIFLAPNSTPSMPTVVTTKRSRKFKTNENQGLLFEME